MAATILFKSLKKTDIENRLALPSKSLKYFPALSGNKHMVDFQARDECGRVWKFRIYTCEKNKYLKRMKPALTKGWREFVCSKELTVGDRVAFYKDKEQAAGKIKYRVRVEKAVRIFGAIFAHRGVAKPGE